VAVTWAAATAAAIVAKHGGYDLDDGSGFVAQTDDNNRAAARSAAPNPPVEG